MKRITPVDALRRAVDLAGGQSALAERLSDKRGGDPVSATRVWNWINRDMKAPSDLCPDIELITGVQCEKLRPDVNWAVLRKPRSKTRIVTSNVANLQSATAIP